MLFLRLQPQFQAIFGLKQHMLAELQHHSCCYAAENPRGSGNLLLQGSHQDSALAVQWLSRIASAKRLNIDLETQSSHGDSLSTFRLQTPFQSHAMQQRPPTHTHTHTHPHTHAHSSVSPLPTTSHHSLLAAPSSPASFTQSISATPFKFNFIVSLFLTSFLLFFPRFPQASIVGRVTARQPRTRNPPLSNHDLVSALTYPCKFHHAFFYCRNQISLL